MIYQNFTSLARSLAQSNLIHYATLVDSNYKANWHHKIIAEKLQEVESGKIKRLMICVPPRHWKSYLASILFPSWYLWKNPEKSVMITSYSASLSETFSRQCRNLLYDHNYQRVFNTRVADDAKSVKEWLTNRWWKYIASWVWWAITGKGFDIWIIDDPVSNREEAESETISQNIWDWYTSTFYTRQEKDAAIIVIMTRWHEDDLSGRLLNLQEELNKKDLKWEKWEIINFPAIAVDDELFREPWEALWEEKYSTSYLEFVRSEIWIRDFEALYQQNPVPLDTWDFTKSMFRYYDYVDIKKLEVITFIDPAVSQKQTADYTAIVTVWIDTEDRNKIYVLDYFQKRVNTNEMMDYLFDIAREFDPSRVWIEKVWFQECLIEEIEKQMDLRNRYFTLDPVMPKWEKEARIRSNLQARYSMGKIWHKRWESSELEKELLKFPSGKHNDIIDALSYAVSMLRVFNYDRYRDEYSEWYFLRERMRIKRRKMNLLW